MMPRASNHNLSLRAFCCSALVAGLLAQAGSAYSALTIATAHHSTCEPYNNGSIVRVLDYTYNSSASDGTLICPHQVGSDADEYIDGPRVLIYDGNDSAGASAQACETFYSVGSPGGACDTADTSTNVFTGWKELDPDASIWSSTDVKYVKIVLPGLDGLSSSRVAAVLFDGTI